MTEALPARSSDARPVVRVVCVTFSPGSALPEFLDSLTGATTRDSHVVLADNGSTDGSVEAAAKRPSVTVVRTGGNLGYGGAANVGVLADGPRPADEEWVVVANPDVVWSPGSLDALLGATAGWPDAGAFGPAIRTPDGALYPSARAFPSLGRGIGHALLGWWWPRNPFTAGYRGERASPAEGPTDWLSGSCLLLRRKAFAAVGGFDPSYFMYFEDLDLCRRLVAAGWRSVYVPSAVVTHSGGHATARDQRAMVRAHHRSAYRYLSRQYAGLRWAPLRALLAVGLTLRYWLALRVRPVREGAQPVRSASMLD